MARLSRSIETFGVEVSEKLKFVSVMKYAEKASANERRPCPYSFGPSTCASHGSVSRGVAYVETCKIIRIVKFFLKEAIERWFPG